MILIDNILSNIPAYNLAIEEALLRRENDHNSYLLIYINSPSVVIGRHQNIYEEVNLKYCHNNNIPVLRRISGGGAVWHDSGNLNFSFITDKSAKLVNNYQPFLQPVVSALREMGVNAVQNEQNDLTLDEKKICGTAQFTSKDRMLTHGTLLFNADLQKARSALSMPLHSFYNSKSKKSRISPIANIAEYINQPLDMEEFKQRLINILRKNNIIKDVETLNDNVKSAAKKLMDERYEQWLWNYGRSPVSMFKREMHFSHGHISVKMKIEHGIFKEVAMESDFIKNNKINRIENLFKEQKNDILCVEKISNEIKELSVYNIDWLTLLYE